MSEVKPPTNKVLSRIAYYRANGFGWDWIADKEELDEEVLKLWPNRYRIRWQRFMERAEHDLILEGSAESIQTSREQLRLKGEKHEEDRHQAANRLIRLRIEKMKIDYKDRKIKAGLAGDSNQYSVMFRYLGGRSNEEIQAIMEACDTYTQNATPALGTCEIVA